MAKILKTIKADNKSVKILGTKENPVVKNFDISECKVTEEDGLIVVRGYANTKGNKDRYGDIPTVFPSVRNYVYELTDFLKNPVMLLDHSNKVSHIAGSFTEIVEDEIGLRFKAVFSNSDLPEIKHARTVFLEGHGRAFSIAGRWHFEDKENPDHLTYAEIYHISPVGVGADPDALGYTAAEKPEPKEIIAEEERTPEAPKGLTPGAVKETLKNLVSALGDDEVKKQLKNSILELKKTLGTEKPQEE